MKRNKKRWIMAVVPLVALALWVECGPGLGVPFVVWRHFGNSATRAIARADRVEVFRIADQKDGESGPTHLHGYRILAHGQTQNADFARRLRDALLDQKSFLRSYENSCIFHPGVVFRVHGSGGDLDVMVCYHCADFGLYDAADKDWRHFGFVYHNFTPVYADMVALAKQAFPRDKAIQSLDAHKFNR